VRLVYARLLVELQQPSLARDEFALLIKRRPNDVQILYAYGLLSMQLKDYAIARQTFLRLLQHKNYENSNLLRMYLAQLSEELKQFPEALSWYQAITEGELFFQAQERYANLLAARGDVPGARTHLQRLAVANPSLFSSYVTAEAGVVEEALGAQIALDFVQEHLKHHPQAAELFYLAGTLAAKTHRIDLVEHHLLRAIELRPDYAAAYNALGYSFAERNLRLQEAHAWINRALELAPTDPAILDSKGWVLFRLGYAQEALAYLQRSYELYADEEVAAHIYEVRYGLGQCVPAQQWLKDSGVDGKILQAALKRLPCVSAR
jgi:tetratricopeptide (TPR) repeat protein